MTVEEKAKELVESFGNNMSDGLYDWAKIKYGKQCASIAVHEIIKALFEYDKNTEEYLKEDRPEYFSCELQNMDRDLNYWQAVHEEINKL